MDVLVIEDNPIVQSGLTRSLEHAGFNVTAVSDALTALSALERKAFDAIVCDVNLPVVDGMQLYGEVAKNHPSLSHRFVFVTAMVDDPEVRAFLDRIGRPALGKPFELDQLVATVREVAEQSSMLDEPVIGLRTRDRAAARALPDEFARMEGPPLSRLTQLVERHWDSVADSEQRQLEQMLMVLLEPLFEGGQVTDELRRQCEDAVMGWAARQ